MLWMMQRKKPKDVARVTFFHAQYFGSSFYSNYSGFDYCSIHSICPFFECFLGEIAGYSLVFSKWYSSTIESNKNFSKLKPQADPPRLKTFLEWCELVPERSYPPQHFSVGR